MKIHEKSMKKRCQKVWRICLRALLLHSHSRENGAQDMMMRGKAEEAVTLKYKDEVGKVNHISFVLR